MAPNGDAKAYSDALKEMLDSPEERVPRAVALRDSAYVAVTFRVAPDRRTRAVPSASPRP